MEAVDDLELLRQYAADGSETAFETLVSRRVRFVYSAALRQVRDPDLAEEVTQAVFIILAQKAGKIHGEVMLSGWLFKTTRFVALSQVRAAVRRHHYEKEAQLQSEVEPVAPDPLWEQMSPLLDEALLQLGERDRQTLLLRFFENKTLAEVGGALGVAEDAARMRVNRALEKLRRYFLKRGIVASSAIVAGLMTVNSVQAEPAALAKTVVAAAILKGSMASPSTLTLIKGALKIMAWTKAKTAVTVGVCVLLTAGVTTAVLEIKGRADRKNDPVAYEIQHQSSLLKIFPRQIDDHALRQQLVGTWAIEAKKFRHRSTKYTYFIKDNRPLTTFALFKTWTLTNWSIVTYDGSSNVVYSASGPYELNGNDYTETIETATGDMTNYLGSRPRFKITVRDGKYYQMNASLEEIGQRVSQ